MMSRPAEFEQDDGGGIVQRHDDGDEDRCGRRSGRAEHALGHRDAEQDEVRAVDGLDDDTLFVFFPDEARHRESEQDPEEHEAPGADGDESPTHMEVRVHVARFQNMGERKSN